MRTASKPGLEAHVMCCGADYRHLWEFDSGREEPSFSRHLLTSYSSCLIRGKWVTTSDVDSSSSYRASRFCGEKVIWTSICSGEKDNSFKTLSTHTPHNKVKERLEVLSRNCWRREQGSWDLRARLKKKACLLSTTELGKMPHYLHSFSVSYFHYCCYSRALPVLYTQQLTVLNWHNKTLICRVADLELS